MTDIRIPGAAVLYGAEPEHVVYKITCRSGRATWRSDRRYREFYDFHQSLCKATCNRRECGLARAAELPSRMVTSWGNHSPAQIKKRRLGLENYLRSLKGLCGRHESMLDEFVSSTSKGLLDYSSEGCSATALLRHERSHWACEGPAQLAAYDGLQLQFWDTCLCTFRPAGGGLTLGVLLCTPQGVNRRRLRFDVEVFRRMVCQLCTSSSFPTLADCRAAHSTLLEVGEREWGFDPAVFESLRRGAKSEIKRKHRQSKRQAMHRSPLAVLHDEFAEETAALLAALWRHGGREPHTSQQLVPPVDPDAPVEPPEELLGAMRAALDGPNAAAVRAALAAPRFRRWRRTGGVAFPPTQGDMLDFGRELVGHLTTGHASSSCCIDDSFNHSDDDAELQGGLEAATGSPGPRSPGVVFVSDLHESQLVITPATPPEPAGAALSTMDLGHDCFCCGRSDPGSPISTPKSVSDDDMRAASPGGTEGIEHICDNLDAPSSPEGADTESSDTEPDVHCGTPELGEQGSSASSSTPRLLCFCTSRTFRVSLSRLLAPPSKSALEPPMTEILKKIKREQKQRQE